MNASTLQRLYGNAVPTRRFEAVSADGTRLAVQEWGRSDGPTLLFLHAWSQSHLGWAPQLQGALASEFRLITFDQRGHGESDRPNAIEAYTDNTRWADDVKAVVDAAGIDRAVLVPWSLGGVVALDYVARHGEDKVVGIAFVAAGNTIGTERAATHFGAAVGAHAQNALSPELRTRLEGLLRLQQALVYRELSIEDFGELVTQAIAASPTARAGWLSRNVDHEATLRALCAPILLVHGDEDAILTRRASEDVQRFSPQAKATWYAGAGHAPHFEDPERFDCELAVFARAAFAMPYGRR
jgi:non-heme chloroperoxidase